MNSECQIKDKVVIYGTGIFAIRVAEALQKLNVKIVAFIDHLELKSSVIMNIPVIDSRLFEVDGDEILLLGVHNPLADLQKIYNLMTLKNFKSILTPVQISQELSKANIRLDNYWLTSSDEFWEVSRKKIQEFENLLVDVVSKKIYSHQILYRSKGLIQYLDYQTVPESQYIVPDINTPPRNLHLLELGAFHGEDLMRFKLNGFHFESGFSLEPDAQNYPILVDTLSRNSDIAIIPLPLAASDRTEILHFDANGRSSSAINPLGQMNVQAVRVDEMLPSARINFVKMDIEGAEKKAISGMRELIKRNLPHLAISAYHLPEDLWELGLLIESISPQSYNYYLRSHAFQTFDTVLYAVPK